MHIRPPPHINYHYLFRELQPLPSPTNQEERHFISQKTSLVTFVTFWGEEAPRKMTQAPEAFDLKCWTKSGAIFEVHDAVVLRYNFYEGTQQFKIPASRQIRTIRINLIFELNNIPVFL